MKIVKFVLGSILLVCLIIGASYPLIINNLIVDEDPIPSDVIIVPEGDSVVRSLRAFELLRDGFSESGKIMVSPLNEYNVYDYLKFGLAREQIIPETEATSTYENAVFTLSIMEDNGFDSAIIVSSDFHMLRTKLIYERLNKEYDFELTYVAAFQMIDGEPTPWYDLNVDIGNQEFWKIWGYLLGMYHFFDL